MVRTYSDGEAPLAEGALLKQLGTAGIAGTPNPSFNPQATSPRN
jgi:hypothetical protein